MTYYNPDSAVVIKITNKNNESHFRVFGCYVGGYLNGSSYRINSGIVKISYDNNYYYFEGESGSIYKCRISPHCFDHYCTSVLNSMCLSVEKEGGVVEVIEMSSLREALDINFQFENLL